MLPTALKASTPFHNFHLTSVSYVNHSYENSIARYLPKAAWIADDAGGAREDCGLRLWHVECDDIACAARQLLFKQLSSVESIDGFLTLATVNRQGEEGLQWT